MRPVLTCGRIRPLCRVLIDSRMAKEHPGSQRDGLRPFRLDAFLKMFLVVTRRYSLRSRSMASTASLLRCNVCGRNGGAV